MIALKSPLLATRRKAISGLIVYLSLIPAGFACSKDRQGDKTTPAQPPASSTTATNPSATSKHATPSAPLALAPPTLPESPAQLVACGERDFYRITDKALQVFEVSPDVPPPHIRGSRVSRQTTEIAVDGPQSVISFAAGGALVFGRENVFRYELGKTETTRYGAVPDGQPLELWTGAKNGLAFWTRRQRDAQLREYVLAQPRSAPMEPTKPKAGALGTAGATAPPPAKEQPLAPGKTQLLQDFDFELFTVLADGSPLFSSGADLRRVTGTARAQRPPRSKSAALLFADPDPKYFWHADTGGHLTRWDVEGGPGPVSELRVPGVVAAIAQQGNRLAVLSVGVDRQYYRPTATIIINGREEHHLNIAPLIGRSGPPHLDLCLLPGRPWLVVGNRYWLQLLDWTSPRLLAEW